MADRANKEQLHSFRRPQIIFTDAYLDDPIKFKRDERFDAESSLRDADPTLLIVDRDEAEFAVVELNSATGQFYSVHMYQSFIDREEYEKIIQKKRQIIQLLATEDA